jgi:outer membrane receptor for ferrienterochelin and colicins
LLALGTAQAAVSNVTDVTDVTDTLPRIVVSATRHAVPLIDAPAAITVVDAEQLAERGTDNLLQALRVEPGVGAFGRPTGGRKSLSLRGMDPRHVLVLVDGQRISASDGLVGSSDFQLDWAGAVDIARIEVVRGPMSVLYGAEALGGVINVITQPLNGELQARAFVEGRSGQRGGDGHRMAAALRGGFRPRAQRRAPRGHARHHGRPHHRRRGPPAARGRAEAAMAPRAGAEPGLGQPPWRRAALAGRPRALGPAALPPEPAPPRARPPCAAMGR